MREHTMQHMLSDRRGFLRTAAAGFGYTAFAGLAAMDSLKANGAKNPLLPKAPHFEAKAKRVIFLFMQGGPTQHDTFDYNPALVKHAGQTSEMKLSIGTQGGKILPPVYEFKPSGESGLPISEIFPHLRQHADEMCLLNGMHTDSPAHPQASIFAHTGSITFVRPSIGSWVVYGLGTENQDLPGFVVLSSGRGASGGSSNFSSGFLPSTYAGVPFRKSGDPILFLSNPRGVSRDSQRLSLETLRRLNEEKQRSSGDPQVASRMANYELAFRMQASAPELLDFSDESQSTKDSYGIDQDPTSAYGTNCLMARRMVERGVRVVMLIHASWDDHTNLDEGLKKNCDITDKPVAALLEDLKQRGLLDETLVVWGGEFGRTSLGQLKHVGDKVGRDHHPNGFSMWLAGGGTKGGQVIGSTDELALEVEEDPVHVHDLQATILHLMGLDHERLTYRHMGRDFRLTDVSGRVVDEILA